MINYQKINNITFCFFTDGKETDEKKLKYFPAGYLGKFYRNLADNVESFLRSDFDRRITNDAYRPSQDVKKYLYTTSDFLRACRTLVIIM